MLRLKQLELNNQSTISRSGFKSSPLKISPRKQLSLQKQQPSPTNIELPQISTFTFRKKRVSVQCRKLRKRDSSLNDSNNYINNKYYLQQQIIGHKIDSYYYNKEKPRMVRVNYSPQKQKSYTLQADQEGWTDLEKIEQYYLIL